MFKMPEPAMQSAGRAVEVGIGSLAGADRAETRSVYLNDGFFSGFEEPMAGAHAAGPGDSSYELTFTLGDIEGDSDPGWGPPPALPDALSSDEIPVAQPPEPTPGPDREQSWAYGFLRSWGSRLIIAALALFAAGLPVLGFLLVRLLGPGASGDRTMAALVAGFAGALALLMVSIPLILLASFMAELVREVRRLSDLSAVRPGAVGRR